MNFTTPWKQRGKIDKQDVVRHLLETDGLTSGQAAERLGTTRNSVISVASRIPANKGGIRAPNLRDTNARDALARQGALARRQRANEQDARNRERQAAATSKAPRKNPPKPTAEPKANQLAPVPSKAWRALPGSTPKPLHEHQHGECLWPIGDRPMLFCCLPAERDQRYCRVHHALAHPRPTEKTNETRKTS